MWVLVKWFCETLPETLASFPQHLKNFQTELNYTNARKVVIHLTNYRNWWYLKSRHFNNKKTGKHIQKIFFFRQNFGKYSYNWKHSRSNLQTKYWTFFETNTSHNIFRKNEKPVWKVFKNVPHLPHGFLLCFQKLSNLQIGSLFVFVIHKASNTLK